MAFAELLTSNAWTNCCWNAYKSLIPVSTSHSSDPEFSRFDVVVMIAHDQTFEFYSTFTSNYFQDDYENRMVSASKARSKAVKSFERREVQESALVRQRQQID